MISQKCKQDRPPPAMGLDQLPGELVLFVFNHLNGDRDMSSLTRVSWRFYNLLTPGLYRHNARHSNSSALRFSTVRYGLTSIVKKAIDGGADPYRADQTALSDSAETGRQEICELLLNYQPDLLEPSGFTPLCYAVAGDHFIHPAQLHLLLNSILILACSGGIWLSCRLPPARWRGCPYGEHPSLKNEPCCCPR